MKGTAIFSLWCCVLAGALTQRSVAAEPRGAALRINEILARNDHFLFPRPPPRDPADPLYGTPDCVEIYNPTEKFIPLGGLYLTDEAPGSAEEAGRWRFPEGTWIAPFGFVTVLLEGREVQGQLRAGFRLDRNGERIALLAADGEAIIDEVLFSCQLPDVSYARIPDGTGSFVLTSSPTFCWPQEGENCTCRGIDTDGDGTSDRTWCPSGAESPAANRYENRYPPDLDVLDYQPVMPEAGQAVEVTVSVSCHDTEVDSVRLQYQVDGGEIETIELANQGRPELHGRPAPYTVWRGVIPGQPADSVVSFRVFAARGDAVDVEPDHSSIVYTSGRTRWLPVAIAEVMASNVTTARDRSGAFSDWAELVNRSTEEVSLGGLYLTDNRRRPFKWALPAEVVLPPGGRALVWCDGKGTMQEGELHASFKLDADGDDIALADSGGIAQRMRWQQELTDVSLGFTEPGGVLTHFIVPSPGEPNHSGPVPVVHSIAPASLNGETQRIVVAGEALDWIHAAFLVVRTEGSGDDTVPVEQYLNLSITHKQPDSLQLEVPACEFGSEHFLFFTSGGLAVFEPLPCEVPFVRGEVNGDGVVNIGDALAVLSYLFAGSGGPACGDRMDVNDSGSVNIADALYLLGYLFGSRRAPPPPFPEPGADPSEDSLRCVPERR